MEETLIETRESISFISFSSTAIKTLNEQIRSLLGFGESSSNNSVIVD